MPKRAQGVRSEEDENGRIIAPPNPEAEDAQFVSIERPQARLLDPDAFLVEARVIYLGGLKPKSVYYNGTEMETVNAQGKKVWRPNFARDTGQTHVFEREDTLGRPVTSRLVPAGEFKGKPFVICRHIGHLARFLEEKDADGAPVFEVQAGPAGKAKIEAYLRLRQEQAGRNPDRGEPVLRAMGLA